MKELVVDILREIAVLMELVGENPYKVRAYETAARELEKTSRPLEEIVQAEELENIKGIGKGIGEKILEVVKTGSSSLLVDLRGNVPAGLVDMLDIQGLGAKKIRTLWQKLNIQTIEQLECACSEGKIAGLPGFGQKTQSNILNGIASLKENAGLFPCDHALRDAEEIIAHLKKNRAVQAIEIAGSLRRKKEVVRDVDILAASRESALVMEDFVTMASVSKVASHGNTKSSIYMDGGLQVDLRVVSPQEFPYALMYFTGSKEHNTSMRNRAKKMGLKLNEYGLFKGEDLIECKDEASVFEALGLTYIIPELREDQGEIELAELRQLPTLVALEDLKGIFHIHTTYSDGVASLKDIALTAKEMGFQYIGISDHSQSLSIGNGMKPELVHRQLKEIDELNDELAPFHIFKGIEADILSDGSLDYDPDILVRFDFVIGSVHVHLRMPQAQMTRRVIYAIKNPFLTMLGHPTGRLLLKRKPIAIDMQAVIDAAAEHGVIVEINAHPLRLDLDWRLGKYAQERKIMTSINPDAHSIEGLTWLSYGVGIARKGWFEVGRVLNTWPLDEVRRFFAERRQKALR